MHKKEKSGVRKGHYRAKGKRKGGKRIRENREKHTKGSEEGTVQSRGEGRK